MEIKREQMIKYLLRETKYTREELEKLSDKKIKNGIKRKKSAINKFNHT